MAPLNTGTPLLMDMIFFFLCICMLVVKFMYTDFLVYSHPILMANFVTPQKTSHAKATPRVVRRCSWCPRTLLTRRGRRGAVPHELNMVLRMRTESHSQLMGVHFLHNHLELLSRERPVWCEVHIASGKPQECRSFCSLSFPISGLSSFEIHFQCASQQSAADAMAKES